MTKHLLLQKLTRDEAKGIAPEAVAVFPVGATEQHGPHLPVGTDAFAVEHIAQEAAAVAAQQVAVVVTPTLPFGSSQHHLPFGGTMSLMTETYYRVVSDLAESLITSGFRRIFILNGHGGNNELIQLVARDLALKHPADLAAASYWVAAWDALVATGAHLEGRLPGHAGAFETSVVMALRPDLVREPRPHREGEFGADPRSFYPPCRIERHGSWQEIDGYSDSPARGSAEQGATYLAAVVQAVATSIVAFSEATGGSPGEDPQR